MPGSITSSTTRSGGSLLEQLAWRRSPSPASSVAVALALEIADDDVADDRLVVDDENGAHGTHCGPRIAPDVPFSRCSETRNLSARDDVDAGSVPDLEEEPHAQEHPRTLVGVDHRSRCLCGRPGRRLRWRDRAGDLRRRRACTGRSAPRRTSRTPVHPPRASRRSTTSVGCSRTWRSQLREIPASRAGAGRCTRSPSSTTPTPSPPTTRTAAGISTARRRSRPRSRGAPRPTKAWSGSSSAPSSTFRIADDAPSPGGPVGRHGNRRGARAFSFETVRRGARSRPSHPFVRHGRYAYPSSPHEAWGCRGG